MSSSLPTPSLPHPQRTPNYFYPYPTPVLSTLSPSQPLPLPFPLPPLPTPIPSKNLPCPYPLSLIPSPPNTTYGQESFVSMRVKGQLVYPSDRQKENKPCSPPPIFRIKGKNTIHHISNELSTGNH